MSLIDKGIGSFSEEVKDIMKELEDIFDRKSKISDNPHYSQESSSASIPLSKDEMKAFVGLCAMEGISTKDKTAELIKNYIEEKRKQMNK